MALLTGPSECFEVIKSFVEVRAAMKMMQPFDFNERVYGAAVCASRDSHYNTFNRSGQIPHQRDGTTYRGPRDFANIEELVIASNDNTVLFLFTRAFPALLHLCCEQTAGQSWERGRDAVVLGLAHLPAPNGHLWGLRGDIVRALDQFWVLLRDPYQFVDEFVVFSRIARSHGGQVPSGRAM